MSFKYTSSPYLKVQEALLLQGGARHGCHAVQILQLQNISFENDCS